MSNVACRLSNVGCRLSAVECRLSVVCCRLPDVGRRWPVVECRSSAVGRRLSPTAHHPPASHTPHTGRRSPAVECRSSAAGCRSSAAGCRPPPTTRQLPAGCRLSCACHAPKHPQSDFIRTVILLHVNGAFHANGAFRINHTGASIRRRCDNMAQRYGRRIGLCGCGMLFATLHPAPQRAGKEDST